MIAEIKYTLLRIMPFIIILVAIRIAIRRNRLSSVDLYIQPPLSYARFYGCWFFFLLFILFIELVFYNYGILEVTDWKHDLPSSIIRLLGIIILAPIAEELLFRGIFLHKLIQWKVGKHLAILIQAFIFVALHSFAYENTLTSNIGIAQGFFDAIIFGYAKFYTKSIYTPIAMHATGNIMAVIEQFII